MRHITHISCANKTWEINLNCKRAFMLFNFDAEVWILLLKTFLSVGNFGEMSATEVDIDDKNAKKR